MIPVVLSGGSGTRLWPVSRANYPKQFCEFYDQSFLKNSIDRLKPFGSPHVLTVESMRALTDKTLVECDESTENGIYEPFGKNTAPAVALLCHILEKRGKAEEVVGIFPADHLIADEEAFRKTVDLGVKCAEAGEVVTLGIYPRFPATGYGYIELTSDVEEKAGDLEARRVAGFREKPDKATAEDFLKAGNYYWNAGMFLFKASKMIELFKEHLPEVWEKICGIEADLSNAKYLYANIEGISLDYGIMEKLKTQVCIPCDIGWSDVGSWDEISRLAEAYPNMQTESHASVFSKDASSNYVFSIRNKVIGLVGVQNLLVVDTPDAVLIAKKGQSEKVKDLVDQMKQVSLPEAEHHRFETRPWGGYEILADDEAYKAKKITVEPGAKLSYQSHQKRSEHWVVISGTAEVTLDDEIKTVKPGEHIFIPKQSKHRIHNPGKEKMVFVEVQTGSYFGEDDIVRYDDDYGRVK